jgi:putative Mg2+ transporter-C (MgtC) family protein
VEAGTRAPIHLGWLDVALRLGAALLLSLALGVERYWRRKPVDFRPFVIVAVASCALIIAIVEFAARATDDSLSVDPAKVVSGILTGIGFLGAGALFREKHIVHGAGSASSIWAGGALGVVCGFGFLWLGAALAVAVVGTLLLSRPFTDAYTISADNKDDAD